VKSEAGKQSWRTWKEKHAKLEADYLEAQKRENAVKSEVERLQKEYQQRVDPKDVEALKKERDEIALRLRIHDVREDPSWQKEIERPLAEAMAKAKSSVRPEHRVALERLLAQPPSDERFDAIEQIVSELSPLRQQQVATQLAEVDRINQRREALMSDQKSLADRFAAFKREEEERAATSSKAELEQTVEAVLKRASDPQNGLGVFQSDRDAVEQARTYAMADPSPQNRANLAAWAVQGQRSVALLKAAGAEIEKLNAQISKLTQAQPTGGTAAPGSAPKKPMSFVEAINQSMTTGG
jgi:DNA repair exonuclease SbcCD ATPase subunit